MKLYNKGGRALILPSEQVISGGRYQDHDKAKLKAYFDPSKNIEVTEEWGKKLLGMYPEMLVVMDNEEQKKPKSSKKSKATKKVKKG